LSLAPASDARLRIFPWRFAKRRYPVHSIGCQFGARNLLACGAILGRPLPPLLLSKCIFRIITNDKSHRKTGDNTAAQSLQMVGR
jgi:hypothetical protein